MLYYEFQRNLRVSIYKNCIKQFKWVDGIMVFENDLAIIIIYDIPKACSTFGGTSDMEHIHTYFHKLEETTQSYSVQKIN